MLRCLLVFVCLPAAVKATYYVYFHHPPHQPPYAHYVYFFGLSQFLKFLLGLVVAGFKINAAGYLPCKHAPKSRAVTRDGTEHEQNNDGKYPPEVQRLLDDLGLHQDFVIGALPPHLRLHTRGPHNARVPHADGGKLVAETVDDAEEFAEKYRALVVAEIQVAILWAACSSVTLRASRKRTPREKRRRPLRRQRDENNSTYRDTITPRRQVRLRDRLSLKHTGRALRRAPRHQRESNGTACE